MIFSQGKQSLSTLSILRHDSVLHESMAFDNIASFHAKREMLSKHDVNLTSARRIGLEVYLEDQTNVGRHVDIASLSRVHTKNYNCRYEVMTGCDQ